MHKRNVYRCECGNRLQVRQVVKNDVTTCPACARVLPKKLIMQCYYNRRRTRTTTMRIVCKCGKKNRVPFPTDTGKWLCPRCGARLFEVKTKTINGVALPRYIEVN